jgi:chemotaxis protein MotB
MKIADLAEQADDQDMTSFYISFSDLMVLLSVFFVMLLSMSKVDIGSFEKIRSGFTGSTEGTLVELASELKQVAEGTPGVPGVNVHLAEDGVRLDLDTASLFETGSANLKANALEPLTPLLEKIEATDYQVDVEGHTDDVPLYRFYEVNDERVLETNWSLSGRRAASVIHHLLDFGFEQSRVRLVGYSSTRPIVPTDQKQGEQLEEARAKNRRVSLLVN